MKRRNLLKSFINLGAASSFTPMQRFLSAIVTGNLYEEKIKTTQQNETRNFLHINLYGAPSRLGFDNLLKPFDYNEFLAFERAANKIESQNPNNLADIKFKYETTKIRGLNLPVQWLQQLPAPHGKTRPMTDLLNNMLIIRGCRLSSSSHPLNGMRQICPVQGGLSLNGLIGDHSPALFSSIAIGNNAVTQSFSANKCQQTEIPFEEKNYLDYLLRPFYKNKENANFSAVEVEKDFDEIAKLYPDQYQSLASIKKKSVQNMKDNFEIYLAQYGKLVHKYDDLIQRAITTIDYLPEIKSPKFPLVIGNKTTLIEALGPFLLDGKISLDESITSTVRAGKIKYWAEEFALAEFLLLNKLSKSILLCSPAEDMGYLLEDMNYKNLINLADLEVIADENSGQNTIDFKKHILNAEKKPNTFSISQPVVMDGHAQGYIYDQLATPIFFRALSSCLVELIDVLKKTKLGNKNLFDETVIQVASEFERYSINSGGSTQHLPEANPTSIFTGCIQGPQVIGNIFIGRLDKDPTDYYGTLGIGAPVKELAKPISIGNVSSTLSTLLRAPLIVKREQSLVEEKNGKVVSLIEPPQNIEGRF